jgi:hypothetical protein
MSNSINVAFVQQFKDNLRLLAQQKGSKVLPHVAVETIVGKYTHFERLGGTEAVEVLTRHGDTPDPANLVHSRRRAILRTFEAAELIDDADKVRLLIDPTNAYAMQLAYGLGRKADDIILAAMYGDAQSVDSADAQGAVSFAAGNIVDEDFNTANSDLIVEKLREARRILLVNNVDLDAEQPILLHDGTALMSLLSDTEVTSADFNTVKALVNGQLDTFMGFRFVNVERLATAAHKTSEGFVRALVFVPSAMGVAVGRDMNVRIGERADKRYSTQVYAAMDIGATRIEEEKVVSIECYRA